MFFEWLGFAMSYFLSQSHASKYGAIAGLGITIALQSIRINDLPLHSEFWRARIAFIPLISMIVGFAGYIVFLFGLFSYHRKRLDAQGQVSSSRIYAA